MNGIVLAEAYKTRLLQVLLDKYEKSKGFVSGETSKQRPQISLRSSTFYSDYTDEMDFRKRESFHDAVRELEAAGIVELRWAKFQEGRFLEKILLSPEKIEEAYRVSGLVPKQDKLDRLRSALQDLRVHPWNWVREWWERIDRELESHKSTGMDANDPEGYRDLATVLLALPSLRPDTPKRVLSQQLFKDSKRFEQRVETRLLGLLRSSGEVEYETDEEYLDSIGIVNHPRQILLCGKLRFCAGGGEQVAVESFPGGLGLFNQTVKDIRITALEAKRIVTIENLTSYHQWIRQRPEGDDLVLYTGGFPNGTLQQVFASIADFREHYCSNVPVYHWGDLDLGGIRIFQYIQRCFFADLQPLLMDRDTFLRYADQGTVVSERYLVSVEKVMGEAIYKPWQDILKLMLECRARIEQESITDVSAAVH